MRRTQCLVDPGRFGNSSDVARRWVGEGTWANNSRGSQLHFTAPVGKVRASLQTILGRPAADLVWKRPSNKIDDILKIAKPEWRIIPPCKPCRRDVVAAFKIATDKLKTFAQAIVSIPEE